MQALISWILRYQAPLLHAGLSIVLAATGWFALQWREILWPRNNQSAVRWENLGMDPLQTLSFDLPFLARSLVPALVRSSPPPPTEDIVILYMDDLSALQLGQTPGRPFPRALHTQLLHRLADEGAAAVLFDAVFDSESDDDPEFANALARCGNVFLGASLESDLHADLGSTAGQPGFATEQLSKRNKTLYKSAKGWGLLTFRPLDPDYGVRRLFPGLPRDGLDPWASITWKAAQFLGADLPPDPHPDRFRNRWIQFYGPPHFLPHASYARALQADGGIAPGFFKNKIVWIGGRSQLASSPGKLLDEFSTPWSRFHGQVYTPGVEIHATALLNLLHRDWLNRVPPRAELLFVLLFGLALGALRYLSPLRALATAGLVTLLIASAAFALHWHFHLWSNWCVPALVQTPLAAIGAISSRYYLEERNKRKLRSAFSLYLCPEIAEEISEREFSLAPGGQKVEATLLFTDMEGFTTLSEALGDSARLGSELVRYFTNATDVILEEHGTVIKFIGDAIYAAWGAPLPQPDQAERAVRAALALEKATHLEIPIPLPDGSTGSFPVRTRIGIHTGEALAGNLGSKRRFDYTLIGDSVNFAARLEGLNKYTGTTILLSDATAQRLHNQFLLRPLGIFQVKGKQQGLPIHEPLGDHSTPPPTWLPTWLHALHAWNHRDFHAARAAFESVRSQRGGSDGPSEFYLARLTKAEQLPATAPWSPTIVLDEK